MNATNCTEFDNVISMQWGGSDITLNPIYTAVADNAFITSAFSYASGWSGQTTPGVDYPPEIYAYMNLPWNQTDKTT
jgi:hypothetical protein